MAEAERIIGTPDVEGAEPEQPSKAESAAAGRAAGDSAGTARAGEPVGGSAAGGAEGAAGRAPEGSSQVDGEAVPAGRGKRKLAVLFVIALLAYALDLGTKLLVVAKLEPSGETIDVIGELLQFRAIRNPGAAFGFGEAFTIIFTIIAASVIVVIARLARKLYSTPWAIALGLLLGGALGNLTDRIFRTPGFLEGAVVDFIAPVNFAVFNLADSAIVCGGILIVILSFRGLDPDGTVHKD
ncbi:signal peptidase II [Streptomyces candidus]|uniref:Lipoprotein signal peptidase n=1 Tax=Streptomyces candidus TaxID=67283 RepID=A0A7X0H9S7_9ACTN|nr:signal peptidase II [Streptomyces candidus]MBB6433720.1 signal peptidase II [Streptomyces candidus]GHH34856.1 lipoprotein signal peptidase [Streptomyces candidus]